MNAPTRHSAEICQWDRTEHYELMASWWRAVGIEPMPVDCFPETGVIALHEGLPAAMSFCYFTDAMVAWVAFTVASPDVHARARLRSIIAALRGAVMAAHSHVGDGGFIWSMTDHPTLQRIYVDHIGFTPSSLAGNYVIPGKDVPTGMLI